MPRSIGGMRHYLPHFLRSVCLRSCLRSLPEGPSKSRVDIMPLLHFAYWIPPQLGRAGCYPQLRSLSTTSEQQTPPPRPVLRNWGVGSF